MTKTPGTRVFAVRSATADTVELFGFGTYIGDEICPMKLQLLGDEEELKAMIAEEIARSDSGDAGRFEDHMIEYLAETQGWSEEKIASERAKSSEKLAAERARPMAERIEEIKLSMTKNPCIKLDNGNIVWGMESWWGPEDKFEEKFGGRTIIEVTPSSVQDLPGS